MDVAEYCQSHICNHHMVRSRVKLPASLNLRVHQRAIRLPKPFELPTVWFKSHWGSPNTDSVCPKFVQQPGGVHRLHLGRQVQQRTSPGRQIPSVTAYTTMIRFCAGFMSTSILSVFETKNSDCGDKSRLIVCYKGFGSIEKILAESSSRL